MIKTHDALQATDNRATSDLEEAIDLGLGRLPLTEFDRLLLAARREYLAAEGRFLDRDELDRELAGRRGGASLANEE